MQLRDAWRIVVRQRTVVEGAAKVAVMSPEGRRHGGEHEVIPGPPASVTRRTGLGSLRRASRRIGNLETSPSVALSSGNQGSWCGWVRRYPGKGLSVLTPPSFTSMIRTDRTLSDVGLGQYPQAKIRSMAYSVVQQSLAPKSGYGRFLVIGADPSEKQARIAK